MNKELNILNKTVKAHTRGFTMDRVRNSQKESIRRYWIEGLTLTEIVKKVGMKRSTVYYYAKQYNLERQERMEKNPETEEKFTPTIKEVKEFLEVIGNLPQWMDLIAGKKDKTERRNKNNDYK